MISEITEKDNEAFLTAKIDRLFKTVFVNSEDTRFMNAILSEALEEPVEVVQFYPNDLPVRDKNEKVKVIDVLLKAKNNRMILVEVNTNFSLSVRVRNLCFFTSFFSQNVKRPNRYDTDTEFVHIDFYMGGKNGKLKTTYQLMNESGDTYVSNFKIVAINLESIKKKWYDKNISGDKDNIHLVMLTANEAELNELSKQDELVKEFEDRMYILNHDGTFTRTISEEEDQRLLLNTIKEEGYKEGRLEGEIAGEKKGETERNIAIAKNMLNKNYAIPEIIDLTGLTEKEIIELKNDQQEN